MKNKELNKLKELIETSKQELKSEENLFDNSNNIKDKEEHLYNIQKLNVKIGQLGVKLEKLNETYTENEDTIKAPFEYNLGSDEFGAFGFFRTDTEEY